MDRKVWLSYSGPEIVCPSRVREQHNRPDEQRAESVYNRSRLDMARIKYTALVESIRGSIQGTTFQRNAYGYTVKGKPNMVNPNTNLQSASKRNMSGIAQAWSSLSDSDRNAWDTWAATNPVPSRLNPDANLTGFAQFTRWHNIRWLYAYGDVLANP